MSNTVDKKQRKRAHKAVSQIIGTSESGRGVTRECRAQQADQLSNSSAQGANFGGIGKKRTYKELERWDIHPTKSQKAFPFNQDDTRSIGNVSNKSGCKGESSSIRTLKFNSRLL